MVWCRAQGTEGDEDLSGLSKEEMGRRIAERWTGGGAQHSDEIEPEADAGEGMAADEDLASLSKDEMGRKVAERWTGHTESVYKEDEEEVPDEDEPDYPHDEDEDFHAHEHDPHQDEGPPPEDDIDESSSPGPLDCTLLRAPLHTLLLFRGRSRDSS